MSDIEFIGGLWLSMFWREKNQIKFDLVIEFLTGKKLDAKIMITSKKQLAFFTERGAWDFYLML